MTLDRVHRPAGPLAANQGSVQVPADGRVLVSWGNVPYFPEVPDGTLIMDGQFPKADQAYRSFTAAWTCHPTDKPAAARVKPADGTAVDASWGTAVDASWTWAAGLDGLTVLGGMSARALEKAGSQRRTACETVITVSAQGRHFAVTANDVSGHVPAQPRTTEIRT